MAKKQQPGGIKNIPVVQQDSEQDLFSVKVNAAVTSAYNNLPDIRKLPAGIERDTLVEETEQFLREAEKVSKDIITGTIASGLAVGKIKPVRREFDQLRKMLDGAGGASLRSAADAE